MDGTETEPRNGTSPDEEEQRDPAGGAPPADPRAAFASPPEGSASRSIRRMQLLKRGEQRSRRMVAAVPIAVFVGALAVFAALARFMHGQECESIELTTRLTADEVSRGIEAYVTMRLKVLTGMRDAWLQGHVHDEESFREHAANMRDLLPGIVAVNWVDPDGVIRWLEPEEDNRAALDHDLDLHPVAGPAIAAARRTGASRMTPPLDLYQGGRGFAIYVPIVRDGRLLGFVNGAFRNATIVADCISDEIEHRQHYDIRDGSEVIHSWNVPSDHEGDPFAVEREIRVANRTWTLRMRPTASQVAAGRTSADEIALALGLLTACLLASIVYSITRGRAQIRTSRERYRSVVDDTPAFICRYRPDGTITFVNTAYARSSGVSPRDLIGASYFDRLPVPLRESSRDELAELDAATPSRMHEEEFVTAAGDVAWQQWVDRALFDSSGNVVEFQSVGLDVTAVRKAQEELRRSEERFRTIFNAVADGILLFDEEGDLKDVNDRACVLFGLGRAELLGRGILALRAAGGGELEAWLQQTAMRGHFAATDWQVTNADGATWQAELELRRTTIAGAPRIVAVVRDVTARAELAEQLRQSQKMESMGTLAGGIAHDFNNILTAIMGHAELARMLIDDDSHEARALEGILAACEQATGVTRSLLTFSRRGETPRTAIDVPTLVRDTLQLLRPLLPGAVEITSDIATNEALWVEADPSQLQQVIMNLAVNARDAMPSGGHLHVSVACESTYDSDRGPREWQEHVVITMSDDGVGMSESVLRRVVEPFFTTKTRERGTGLGMAVVHGIVTGLRGTLDIDSTEGVGTTVRVSLPRSGAPSAMAGDAPATVRRRAADGARVLVVEDNAQVLDLLDDVLADEGFRVDRERNGTTAFETYAASAGEWRLVVLDIDLPGITGTEILRRIRDAGDDVPALLISGNPEAAQDAAGDARTRFLQKPFTMREFVAVAVEMAGALASG